MFRYVFIDRRMRVRVPAGVRDRNAAHNLVAAGKKRQVRSGWAGRGRDGRDSLRMSEAIAKAPAARLRRQTMEVSTRDRCGTGQRSCSRSCSMDNRPRRFRPARWALHWRHGRRYARGRHVHGAGLPPPTHKAPFPQAARVRAARLRARRAMPRNSSFFFSCCRYDEILCDHLLHARHSIHFRRGLYSGGYTTAVIRAR